MLYITGGLETSNGRDRANGFNETVRRSSPRSQIIEQTAKWSGPERRQRHDDRAEPEPRHRRGLPRDRHALSGPGTAALTGRGRLVPAGQPGHVAMVAIDGGVGALDAIRAGTLDATISQPVNNYAAYGVQYLQEARAGKKLDAGPTDHDSTIVEQSRATSWTSCRPRS